jgi:hypothetical protein
VFAAQPSELLGLRPEMSYPQANHPNLLTHCELLLDRSEGAFHACVGAKPSASP